MASCTVQEAKGTNIDSCIYTPALIKRIIRTNVVGYELTETVLNDEAALRALVANKVLFFSPYFENATDNSNGASFSETGYGTSIRTQKTNLSISLDYFDAICNREILATYWDGASSGVFLVDDEGRIHGQTTANGVKSVSAKLYHDRYYLKAATGDIAYTGVLSLSMSETEAQNLNGFATDSYLADMDGIRDLSVTFASITAGGFTLTVASGCDGTLVTGLVQANFALVDSSGAASAVSITGVTDNSDGTYTVTTDADATGEYLKTDGVIDLDPLFVELSATVVG